MSAAPLQPQPLYKAERRLCDVWAEYRVCGKGADRTDYGIDVSALKTRDSLAGKVDSVEGLLDDKQDGYSPVPDAALESEFGINFPEQVYNLVERTLKELYKRKEFAAIDKWMMARHWDRLDWGDCNAWYFRDVRAILPDPEEACQRVYLRLKQR